MYFRRAYTFLSMNTEIKLKIELFLNESIVSSKSVSGGCIADSRVIETETDKKYFVKTHSGKANMFINEANSLNELTKPDCIRVPKVILSDNSFLLLEFIEQGSKQALFYSEFGQAFAQMHKFTAKEFGFFEDNYIGATPQYNTATLGGKANWDEFYFQKRLLPQLKFAESNGYSSKELSQGIGKIENKLDKILKGSEEPPTLLHGDLWSGNYLCDNNGKAVLIDPAVYYGHREADLAMTKMFGGFTQTFYESYQNNFPLADGWEYRENIYLLYHYMNHLNLFGSGYYNQCIKLAGYYL